MNAREHILARLRARRRPARAVPAWRTRRSFENLADRFTDALTAVGGEVWRVEDLDEGVDRLHALLVELGAKRVVANHEPPLDRLNLPARLPAFEWFVVGQTPGELRAFCATADVGVSGAIAALAETGSVVVQSGPGRSRLATLLPPVHVAFVAASQLTTDIFTWVAARPDPLPANLVFISGPSKTADIEQTLAVGVHGPGCFICILYPDSSS